MVLPKMRFVEDPEEIQKNAHKQRYAKRWSHYTCTLQGTVYMYMCNVLHSVSRVPAEHVYNGTQIREEAWFRDRLYQVSFYRKTTTYPTQYIL